MDLKFVKMAESELGETKIRRYQALKQFNEWLDKHPFIVNVTRGEMTLVKFEPVYNLIQLPISDETIQLAFLRTTKFNVQRACAKFENCALLKFRYPQYFTFENCRERILSRNMALLNTGMLYALTERDVEGRLVLILKLGRRDPQIFSVADIFQLFQCVFATLMLSSQENHISGYVFVIDHLSVGLNHFFTPNDLKTYLYVMKHCVALRLKKCVVLNVNRFTTTLVDIAKSVMSKKMKERLAVFRDSADLVKHVKPKSILPEYYGGCGDSEEFMVDNFKKLMYQYHDEIQDVWNVELDIGRISASKLRGDGDDEQVIGSFRRLEID